MQHYAERAIARRFKLSKPVQMRPESFLPQTLTPVPRGLARIYKELPNSKRPVGSSCGACHHFSQQALGKVAQHSKSKNNIKRSITFSKIQKSDMDFDKLHDT